MTGLFRPSLIVIVNAYLCVLCVFALKTLFLHEHQTEMKKPVSDRLFEFAAASE
jgi:hypothetical protein